MHEFPIIQQFVKAAETKGLERGTEPTLTTIAIAMLNDNQPIDTIVKYTGLSEEAIKQLTASVRSTT